MMFCKRKNKHGPNFDAIWFELRMVRLELHQILLLISGQKAEIRFLSDDERKSKAKTLRDQYFGVVEEHLPQSVKDQLFILESPTCCAYELSNKNDRLEDRDSESP